MRSLLLALLLCGLGSLCRAQDVVVRSHLEPQAGAVVGQHVRIMVDVLFKDEMPRPPRVTIDEVPGAQILRLETQGTTMTEVIDGRSYIGKRFEFALYPRRGGTMVVPAAAVTLLDAKGDEAGEARGQEVRTEITVPPGVDTAGPVIASKEVTLEEQWSPPRTTSFKSGDAVVRTITRTAADVPAMAMRDLDFPAPAGMRVYRDPPQALDRVDRGDLVGKRIDRITYVFESAGGYVLPGVAQPWWDLTANRLRQAAGEGLQVAVVAPVGPRDWRRLGAVVAGALAGLACVSWWAAVRFRDGYRQWLQSEAKAFRDLQAACRQADLPKIYRQLLAWRRHIARPDAVAGLVENLEQVLFNSGSPARWSSAQCQAFSRKASLSRRTLRKQASDRGKPPDLPPLNPLLSGSGGGRP